MFIQSLESRTLLSASISEKGLPRQMTVVGDTLYYALDTKRDGKLSYSDLIGYTPKTGKRVSITRDDGKAFGKLLYQLSECGGNLLIAESINNSSIFINGVNVWAVAPGQAKAHLISSAPWWSAPFNSVHLGKTTFFTTHLEDSDRGEMLMSLSDSGAAAVRFDLNRLWRGSFPQEMVAYDDKLVMLLEKDGHRARVYVSDGTLNGTTQLTIPGKADHEPRELGVVGSKLVFNLTFAEATDSYIDSHVYQIDGWANQPSEYRYFASQAQSYVQMYGNGQAIIHISMPDGSSFTTYSALNARSTVFLKEEPYDHGAYAFVGNYLYSSAANALRDTDPEAASDSNSIGIGSVISTTVSGDYSFNRFDLIDGGVTTIAHKYGLLVGGFAAIGDTLYYAASDDTLGTSQLWKTDGTLAGTVAVGHAFAGPFAIGDHVFATSASDAKSFNIYEEKTGAIGGRVIQDEGHNTSVSSASGLSHRTVWLDLDHDNILDAKEPTSITDSNGAFHFGSLKPGYYDVRIVNEGNWHAVTPVEQSALKVSAGGLRSPNFVLSDPKHDARISGVAPMLISFGHSYLTYADATLRVIDGGVWRVVKRVRTAADGIFSFKHLAEGNYRVDVMPHDLWESPQTTSSARFHLSMSSKKRVQFTQ